MTGSGVSTILGYSVLAGVLVTTIVLGAQVLRFELRSYRARRRAIQPCEKQDHGCTGRIEAHHDDYSRGLDVQWLCALHHRRLHAQGRALAA